MSPELSWLIRRMGRHIQGLQRRGLPVDSRELEKRWGDRGAARGYLGMFRWRPETGGKAVFRGLRG